MRSAGQQQQQEMMLQQGMQQQQQQQQQHQQASSTFAGGGGGGGASLPPFSQTLGVNVLGNIASSSYGESLPSIASTSLQQDNDLDNVLESLLAMEEANKVRMIFMFEIDN